MPKQLLLIFLLGVSILSAQSRRNFDPEKMIADLKEKLSLTDEQTEKVIQIFNDQREAMQSLRDEGLDREEMFEGMMKLRQQTDNKILEVLSDEQKAKYKEIIAERMNRRKNWQR